MLREPTDSEVLVAALAGEAQEAMGTHPTVESLLSYQEETMAPLAMQSVQDHLVGCRSCCESLLDLGSFVEAGSQFPKAVTNLPAVAAWREFKGRIDAADQPTGGRQIPPAMILGKPHPVFYGLAASLLLGVLGLSLWVGQLRGANAGLQESLAALSAVQVNPPIFYLGGVTRADETTKVIELSSQQPYFLVIVIPRTTAQFRTFEAELSKVGGGVVWRAESALSEAETLRFIFPRHQFPAGEYQLQVYGLAGEQREMVNDEPLTLRY